MAFYEGSQERKFHRQDRICAGSYGMCMIFLVAMLWTQVCVLGLPILYVRSWCLNCLCGLG